MTGRPAEKYTEIGSPLAEERCSKYKGSENV